MSSVILKKSVILLVVVICLLFFISDVSATILHGTIYDIELNELDSVIVTINSTPEQRYVSKEGQYKFELISGDYLLIANMTKCNGICVTKELIHIVDNSLSNSDLIGSSNIDLTNSNSYVFDLFIFPELDLEEDEFLTENLMLDDIEVIDNSKKLIDWYVAVIFAVATILALIVYLYFKVQMIKIERKIDAEEIILELKDNKKRNLKIVGMDNSNMENAHMNNLNVKNIGVKNLNRDDLDLGNFDNNNYVDEDIFKILNIIKSEGGRTTQKYIRKQIPFSEAKISLMIAELEAKGKIEKIKKGRGNIIKLI